MAAAKMRMMKMMSGVKASKKMVGAGLMGNLIRARPFCNVTAVAADQCRIRVVKEEAEETLKKEKEKDLLARSKRMQEVKGFILKTTLEYPFQLPDDYEPAEDIKQLAIFGLDQINQQQRKNLQLVKVLGAWYNYDPWNKYDITLEATDGDGGGKWNYLVSVTKLEVLHRYTKMELVQWVLLDDPYPITYFLPGTDQEHITNMNSRREMDQEHITNMNSRREILRKMSRPFPTSANSSYRWPDPCTLKG